MATSRRTNARAALAARDVLVEIGGRDWDMAKIHLPELVREPRWVVEGDHDYLTEMIWNATLPPLVVVGMNPGKAQPTSTNYVGQYIERAMLIAQRHGFGGLVLVNHWTIAESNSTRALAAPP